MNWKKMMISTIVVYIVYEVLNFIIHGLILSSTYESLQHLWRPEMQQMMWIMYVSELLLAFFFVYIFAKGYEGKGLMEGVRYGLIIGGFMLVPGMLAQYTVYALPFSLVVYWLIFGFIQLVIIGIIVALIYKPLESSEA